MFTHPVPAGCTPHVPNPIFCPGGSAAWDWCCACRVKPGAPRVSVTLAPARFFSMVIPGKLSLLSSNACCQRGRAGAIKGVQEGCVTATSSGLVSPLCREQTGFRVFLGDFVQREKQKTATLG